MPLIITTTTVIGNNTVDDAVRYCTSENGTNALCSHVRFLAMLVDLPWVLLSSSILIKLY